MRITNHNQRKGGNNSHHNDRNGVSSPHIDQERSVNNRNWRCYDTSTNEECEHMLYEELFGDELEKQKERYTKQGHKERIRTIDDLLHSPKTAPDETIYQVGTKDNHIDADTLWDLVTDQLNYELERFPNIYIISVDLHCDEATPHVHVRKTYESQGKPSQVGAFREMGIERPHPEKQLNKWNNEKITYTQMCRQHLIELARDEYHLDIEETPVGESQIHLTTLEYKSQQQSKKLKAMEEKIKELKGDRPSLDTILEQSATIIKLREENSAMRKKLKIPENADVLQESSERSFFSKNHLAL